MLQFPKCAQATNYTATTQRSELQMVATSINYVSLLSSFLLFSFESAEHDTYIFQPSINDKYNDLITNIGHHYLLYILA